MYNTLHKCSTFSLFISAFEFCNLFWLVICKQPAIVHCLKSMVAVRHHDKLFDAVLLQEHILGFCGHRTVYAIYFAGILFPQILRVGCYLRI